jgi:hypothetical protein
MNIHAINCYYKKLEKNTIKFKSYKQFLHVHEVCIIETDFDVIYRFK